MECGECTLCCKLCTIEETNSTNDEYCKHCEVNFACKIHGNHPDQCKTFQCTWSQMEMVHIDLRPDKCKVMFEKINDTLIVGSIDDKLENVSALVNRQIIAFGKEGISVMMQSFNPHRFVCRMVKGANKDEIVKALEEKANDCTKLH